MAYRFVTNIDGGSKDFTSLVGNLSWSSHIDTLGEELSFDFAYNDSKYFESFNFLREGSIVARLKDDEVLRHYIIVNTTTSGRFSRSFTCYDYGWYLNKNETVIQFKGISVSQAIKKLCDKFGIQHSITDITTLVTKIYKDRVISDIIKDLLEQAEQETGTKFFMEMDGDILKVMRQTDLLIDPTIQLSGNTAPFPVRKFISSPSHSTSIEEMKNKIIVVSTGEDSMKVFAEASDEESIATYGLLTEVVTLDDEKNAAQARQIAKNTLNDLSKVKQGSTVTLLGHEDIKAGRLINLDEKITGISGKHLIKSASHTVKKGIHLVSVELEAVE